MKRAITFLPPLMTFLVCGLLLGHGPVTQLAHYHEFADHSVFIGLPHAMDVLSNAGFAIVAIWGMVRLWPLQRDNALQAGWHGYRLFLIGLLFTAFGSGFYHLAPDNMRLVWDRLPIALACAGLLAAVRGEMVPNANGRMSAICLGIYAVISVGWWYATAQYGVDDLRPYLLLQILPIILIPLWQTAYSASVSDRLSYGAALLIYVIAKIAELNDHVLLSHLEYFSGHTLKHLLASVAAGIIIARLIRRVRRSIPVVGSSHTHGHQKDRKKAWA